MTRYQERHCSKEKKKKKRFYNIAIVVCGAVFLIAASFLVKYFVDEKHYNDQLQDLINRVEGTPTPDPSATATATTPDPSVSATPVLSEEERKLAAYQELHAENPDMVGWIKIEGTVVNFPVMHTPNDEEYYLRKGFDKTYSNNGTPFIAAACSVNPQSDNIIIYGHNINGGKMFAALHSYKDKQFYEEHPIIQFDTLWETGKYEIVGVLKTDVSVGNSDTLRYFEFIDAENKEAFDTFIQEVKALSFYDTGVSAEYGDKLITLSTCEYSTVNGRLVVIAKKIVE